MKLHPLDDRIVVRPGDPRRPPPLARLSPTAKEKPQ